MNLLKGMYRECLEGHNGIDLWYISLMAQVPRAARLELLLSDDERLRANRFKREEDRANFVIRRAALRQILAHYLDMDPESIQFCYNQYGKPAILSRRNRNTIAFNLASSQSIAVCAVGHNCEIGVDVEMVRPGIAYQEIADRFFTREEVKVLRSLPAAKRLEGFFCFWTRKEAYVKAVGRGLSIPLNGFSVTLGSREPILIVNNELNQSYSLQWQLLAIRPFHAYVGAVVVGWRHLAT